MKYSNFCPKIPKKFRNLTLSDFDFSGNKRLNNFVGGWIKNPKGFWLHGQIGVGKTMLISILYRIINCNDYMNSVFIEFPELIEELRDYEVREDYIRGVLNCKYIFIDDFLKNFEQKIYTVNDYRNLSRLIDKIYSENVVLICSSMYSKKYIIDNLNGFDNMISRLVELCKFVEVKGGDRRIK